MIMIATISQAQNGLIITIDLKYQEQSQKRKSRYGSANLFIVATRVEDNPSRNST